MIHLILVESRVSNRCRYTLVHSPFVQHVVQQGQSISWQSAQNSRSGSGRNVQIASGTPGKIELLVNLLESTYNNSSGNFEMEAGSCPLRLLS